MNLTPHFTLEELTHSDTAAERGIANVPAPEHLPNIRRLAERLEEVRALFGKPIQIESGYRNPVVNHLVGGVPDSDHALGHAADIQIAGVPDLEVARRIRDSGLKFDQLIREIGRTVHISFAPRLRQQVMRQPGGPGTPCYWGLE
jgi:putative chitinase